MRSSRVSQKHMAIRLGCRANSSSSQNRKRQLRFPKFEMAMPPSLSFPKPKELKKTQRKKLRKSDYRAEKVASALSYMLDTRVKFFTGVDASENSSPPCTRSSFWMNSRIPMQIGGMWFRRLDSTAHCLRSLIPNSVFMIGSGLIQNV